MTFMDANKRNVVWKILISWVEESAEAMVQKAGEFNGTGMEDCVIKWVELVKEKK